MNQSDLEYSFLFNWRALSGPELIREHKFNLPESKHRFDFAHLETKIAIEVEGGTWVKGRHTRGMGFYKDCHKYAKAMFKGWQVFRVDSKIIHEEPEVLERIIEYIREREGGLQMSKLREPAGVSVTVFQPLCVEAEGNGWVRAGYPLALLPIGNKPHLIDPFGVGTGDMNQGGFYRQPMYSIGDAQGETISFGATIIGCFMVGKEQMNLLQHDRTTDLAHFIGHGDGADERLADWISVWRDQG